MQHSEFNLRLPAWLIQQLDKPLPELALDQQKMAWIIELARHNITHGGGPFAAAVFERSTGQLVSVGVNLVIPTTCSVMHAEIVALIMAQQATGNYLLNSNIERSYELFSTTEPCAMCMGAIPWAGISRLLCGARDEDARKIGFDEGDKPENWVAKYAARNISVVRDLCRPAATEVLEQYAQQQGTVY
ncbi:MAG: nucleoside deaminase [Desulfuromonas sp.]|nr:nucleoside deaminase [Desulfuromonas sp.]